MHAVWNWCPHSSQEVRVALSCMLSRHTAQLFSSALSLPSGSFTSIPIESCPPPPPPKLLRPFSTSSFLSSRLSPSLSFMLGRLGELVGQTSPVISESASGCEMVMGSTVIDVSGWFRRSGELRGWFGDVTTCKLVPMTRSPDETAGSVPWLGTELTGSSARTTSGVSAQHHITASRYINITLNLPTAIVSFVRLGIRCTITRTIFFLV